MPRRVRNALALAAALLALALAPVAASACSDALVQLAAPADVVAHGRAATIAIVVADPTLARRTPPAVLVDVDGAGRQAARRVGLSATWRAEVVAPRSGSRFRLGVEWPHRTPYADHCRQELSVPTGPGERREVRGLRWPFTRIVPGERGDGDVLVAQRLEIRLARTHPCRALRRATVEVFVQDERGIQAWRAPDQCRLTGPPLLAPDGAWRVGIAERGHAIAFVPAPRRFPAGRHRFVLRVAVGGRVQWTRTVEVGARWLRRPRVVRQGEADFQAVCVDGNRTVRAADGVLFCRSEGLRRVTVREPVATPITPPEPPAPPELEGDARS